MLWSSRAGFSRRVPFVLDFIDEALDSVIVLSGAKLWIDDDDVDGFP